MAEIIWTENALNDLNSIGEYIEKESKKYARLTVEKLYSSVNILEDFPKVGKIVREFNDNRLRELIKDSYRIVYLIQDYSRIEIITVHRKTRLIKNTFDISKINND